MTSRAACLLALSWFAAGPVGAQDATRPAPLVESPAERASASTLYQRVSPSVVLLLAGDRAGTDAQVGAGCIVSGDGLVLTNAHVVLERGAVAPRISVFLKPDQLTGSIQTDLAAPVTGRVVRMDPVLDLALVQIPVPQGRRPVAIARRIADNGEDTLAIGHPEDGGPWSLTAGIISNRVVAFEGVPGRTMYQVQTPLNPGNSGGPLIDARGELIGVATAAIRRSRDGAPVSGIQFAVSSDAVLRFVRGQILPKQREHGREGSVKTLAARATAYTVPEVSTSSTPTPTTRGAIDPDYEQPARPATHSAIVEKWHEVQKSASDAMEELERQQ